jgi:hypothetical protein
MTVDRLPENAREGSKSDRDQDGLPAATILSMCDRLLGEVGRRSHMFGWLRAPRSGAADHANWLAVDAYYPRSRLVVMCRPSPTPHEALYREQIPAHGLGLLALDPAALGGDPDAAEATLARRLFDLEHVPHRTPGPPKAGPPNLGPSKPGPSKPGPSKREAAQRTPRRERAKEPNWTAVTVERTPVPPAVQQGLGMVVGLALAAALIAEIYLAVVVVALGAGRPLLGLAIALEACSRGLGTVAAERAGERGWACACAVGGAAVVAWFALAPREQRAETEPAPLAGLLALLAGVVAVLALLIGS